MGNLGPQPDLLNINLLFNKIPLVICLYIKIKKLYSRGSDNYPAQGYFWKMLKTKVNGKHIQGKGNTYYYMGGWRSKRESESM